MKALATLTSLAVLASSLGSVATADTLVITRAAPTTYTTIYAVPSYLPQPIPTGPIRCVRAPCVVPTPFPMPSPWCLSCPPMPMDLDDRIIVMPRLILR